MRCAFRLAWWGNRLRRMLFSLQGFRRTGGMGDGVRVFGDGWYDILLPARGRRQPLRSQMMAASPHGWCRTHVMSDEVILTSWRFDRRASGNSKSTAHGVPMSL